MKSYRARPRRKPNLQTQKMRFSSLFLIFLPFSSGKRCGRKPQTIVIQGQCGSEYFDSSTLDMVLVPFQLKRHEMVKTPFTTVLYNNGNWTQSACRRKFSEPPIFSFQLWVNDANLVYITMNVPEERLRSYITCFRQFSVTLGRKLVYSKNGFCFGINKVYPPGSRTFAKRLELDLCAKNVTVVEFPYI